MNQKIDYNTELERFWRIANKSAEQNDIEKADEALDTCLVVLGHATEKNWKRIAGTTLDIWKTRVWMRIEELGLLPD